MAVNADEGEPGTFKDRHYLDTDPHRFLEGMLIAAHVVEAAEIYIYLRDEYPGRAARSWRARSPGCRPADRVLHLRRGAGRLYLRRGILAAREHRGQARLSAAQAALSVPGRPVRPPDADQQCRDAFLGPRHPREGRRLVDGAGPQRPHRAAHLLGLRPRQRARASSSRPAGITVRELIDEYCGGMAEGHAFRAYLPGGASGGILPALDGRHPARFRHAGEVRLLHRLGRGRGPLRQGRHARRGAQPDALLRGRELRPVHALPRRHAEGVAR